MYAVHCHDTKHGVVTQMRTTVTAVTVCSLIRYTKKGVVELLRILLYITGSESKMYNKQEKLGSQSSKP